MDYLFGRRVLFFDRDFAFREEAGQGPGNADAKPPEVSSMNALRTQTTDGNPSSIFFHVLPSSQEPKSCPLRVPK
jgi:hypothetical protein